MIATEPPMLIPISAIGPKPLPARKWTAAATSRCSSVPSVISASSLPPWPRKSNWRTL